MTSKRPVLLARLASFTAIVMWGISFVATKAALHEISPVTLIFTRFALGLVVLFLILTLRREPLILPRSTWPTLAAMGFVGIFVHQMLQAHALTLTTAIRTGWLIGLTPIWSALLAAVFLRESFGPRKLFGLFLGAAGAVVVISRGEISPRVLTLPATRGDLLILMSTVTWAIYTVLGRTTLQRLGSVRATTATMFAGWVMMIPFFISGAGWQQYQHLSSAVLTAIIFLGVGCSSLGYLFWYAALERLDTSQVAAFLYIEPLITLLAAVALLGESVSPTTIVGGIMVLLGVLTVQKSKSGGDC
ncbi:MAG TPA: DMT family transporter [Gemmatimonadales bacterium]|nr:DMT family transporter [Gemmatimonadales bacterium]